MADIIGRYIHFIGIIVFVGCLVSEHMLLTGKVSQQQIKKIARIDKIYGVSAMVVLAAGLMLWLSVGKPADFYSANWIFHSKITLFFIMAALSIYPTIYINKTSRSKAEFHIIPPLIVNLIRVQLACLIIIPLCAVFMAKGYGL